MARELYDATVIESHSDAVRRYCRTHTRTLDDAEDAYQETFVAFLRRRTDRLNEPEAWLIGVAARACARVYRRRTRSEQLACSSSPTSSADPAEVLVGRHFAAQLLERLDPRDREVLGSVYVAGLSPVQAARRLGVSPGNLRVMAMRARRRAQAVVEAMGGVLSGLPPLGWLVRLWERLRDRARRSGHALGQTSTMAQVPSDSLSMLVLAIGLLHFGAGAGSGPPGAPGFASGQVAAPEVATAQFHPAGQRPAASSDGSSPFGGSAPIGSGSGGPAAAGAAGGAPPDLSGDTGSLPAATAPPAAQASSPPGGPLRQTTGDLLPTANPSEGSTGISSMTGAPDGTIYASGLVTPCFATCPVIFRSADRGRSWQHMDGQGFLGGQLIVPPDFPSNPGLFASGPQGLQRSDNAGGSFRTAVPDAQPLRAAADPLSPPGDTRILLGSLPLTVYEQATGLLAPGPLLPPGVKSVTDVAYTARGDLLVAGIAATRSGRPQPGTIVSLCPAGSPTCSMVTALPVASPFRLSVPSWPRDTHVVLLFGRDQLYRSDDDGRTFNGGAVAGVQTVVSATIVPTTGSVLASAAGSDANSPLLLRGRVGDLQPIIATGLPPNGPLRYLLSLPDGAVLGALTVPDGERLVGIRASSDGGSSWSS